MINNVTATRHHKGDAPESIRKVFHKEIDFTSFAYLQSLKNVSESLRVNL